MLMLAQKRLPLLTNFPVVPANDSTMRPAFVKAWPKFVNGTRWEGTPPPKSTDPIVRYLKNPSNFRFLALPTATPRK
jgi:hypothetical protein